MPISTSNALARDHSHSLGGHTWRVGIGAAASVLGAGTLATVSALRWDASLKTSGRMVGGAALAATAGSLVGYAIPPGNDRNGGWSGIAGALAGGATAAAFSRAMVPGLPLDMTILVALPGALIGLVSGFVGSEMRRVD